MRDTWSDTGAISGLVERCVAGDERAWRELFLRYHPIVLRFLRRMGLPAADAADAAQEVFLQAHRYVGRFERRSDIKTWLYKISVSRASRYHRGRKVERAIRLVLLRSPSVPRPGDLIRPEAERLLAGAIGKLKEMHRDVFVMFEIEGLSGEEIARVVDCPVATVWRRLHYARKELEAILAAAEGKPEAGG